MPSSLPSIFKGQRRKVSNPPPSNIYGYNEELLPFSSLPTNTKDVKPQRTEPSRLPSDDATVDTVRIFLYDLLCFRGHGIVQKWPQWILETAAYWVGTGAHLRNYDYDWENLCPKTAGHAQLDSDCKFVQRSEGDCRRLIGRVIEVNVRILKSKEDVGRRQRDDWERTLIGNPPSSRSPTYYGYRSTLSPAAYGSNATLCNATFRPHTPSTRASSVISLQQQPLYFAHDLHVHGLHQYHPISSHYTSSAGDLEPPSRQISQNEIDYSSTRATPMSYGGTSISCKSPSTARTTPPDSIKGGRDKPASLVGVQKHALTQENLLRVVPMPSGPPRADTQSIFSSASRRSSNQQRRVPGDSTTRSNANLRAQQQLSGMNSFPQRYRPKSRNQGPPPTALNCEYSSRPSQGLRHQRSHSTNDLRPHSIASAPSHMYPHRSSSISMGSHPQTMRNSHQYKTVGGTLVNDPQNAEHRGAPSAPVYTPVENTSPIPKKQRSVSLLKSFTSSFRSKRTASTDEYALNQGQYTVWKAGNSKERTEVALKEIERMQGMVPGNLRVEAREQTGPNMRQRDPVTRRPLHTLVESIEIAEVLRGHPRPRV